MQAVLDFLNQAVFSIHGTPTTIAELVGFVLGVATVWLVAKNNIWTFPVGIVQAAFFFVLFLNAKLYTDTYLQVFFIVIQVLGWAAWLKAGPNRTKLSVGRTPVWLGATMLALGAAFVYFMVPVLHNAHGSYPVADSTTTGLSVAAQLLLTWKYLENWYLWIAADLIYIPLYFVKGLYFTSGLYVIFLLICFEGLRHWRKVERGEDEGRGPNSARGKNLIEDASFEVANIRHEPAI